MKYFLILLGLVLVSCGGGGNGPIPPVPPSPIVTIADPMSYIAQSQAPTGSGGLLTWTSPWLYKRLDWGNYQVAQSYLRPDLRSAQTIWSYPPFGPFVAADGDGGEVYVLGPTGGDPSSVYITETQDGGSPNIVSFGLNWWAFDQYVPDCATGWRYGPDLRGRACHTTIAYPATGPPGNQIVVDTIVSEHYAVPVLYTGPMERAFYGKGWGRLAWMAFSQPGCTQIDPARAPPISAFDTGPGPKCDERLNTNIRVNADGLSGATFGWP